MKMRKSIVTLLSCGLLAGMTGTYAPAQEVIFTGEKCPLVLVNPDADGQSEASGAQVDAAENQDEASGAQGGALVNQSGIAVDRADFLGTIGDRYVAVKYADNGADVYALADLADTKAKVPALDFSTLPSVSEWASLGQGSGGDRVKTVQEELIKAGLLEDGGADGMYGEGTAAAVSEFQTRAGLPATGTVDCYTYFTLLGEAFDTEAAGGAEIAEEDGSGDADNEPDPEALDAIITEYPPEFHAEEKFAAIYDHVADPQVLESFKDPGWIFTYDPFEGEGELTLGQGIHIGSFTEDSTQIDRLQMDVDLIVYAFADEEGVVGLVPAFKVTSNGAYRPYVESIALKTGDEVANLPVMVCDGKVEGTNLTETAIVPITGETGLAAGIDALLRIRGASHEYEIEFKAASGIENYVENF